MGRRLKAFRLLCSGHHILEGCDGLWNVQKRFTTLWPGLEGLNYKERLNNLGLFYKERRRIRGDMIEIYIFIRGMDKVGSQIYHSRGIKNEKV